MRDYQAVTTYSELDSLVAELTNSPLVAFDVETGYTTAKPVEKRALDLYHPDFICVGFSVTNDPSWARYVPLRHDSEQFFEPLEVWERMRPVLENHPLLAHHKKFEDRVLRGLPRQKDAQSPIRTARGHDSMLAAYVSGQFKMSNLKDLTKVILGEDQATFASLFTGKDGKPPTAAQVKRSRFNQLVPLDPKVISYACDDAALSLAIYQHILRILSPFQFQVYNLELAISALMVEAEDYGIGVAWEDMRQAMLAGTTFRPKFEEQVREDIAAMTADPRVQEQARTANLASSLQMRKLLYQGLSLSTTRLTEKGELSTDAQALEGLSRKHPGVRGLLDLREVDNLLKRIKKWTVEYAEGVDARIHPGFAQTQVITGRFSANDPAAQQLPKTWLWSTVRDDSLKPLVAGVNGEDHWRGNFREFICAGDGRYLLLFDYCVAPETRVLTSDLRWVAAGDLAAGDELVGFGEDVAAEGRSNKFQRSAVEATKRVQRDCYKVTLEDGRSVVASAEHMWVSIGTSHSSGLTPHLAHINGDAYIPPQRRKWVTTKDLVAGKSKILAPFDVWEEPPAEQQRDFGWLSGFADGESWLFGNYVGFGQIDGPVLQKAKRLLSAFGFKTGSDYVNTASPNSAKNGGVVRFYLSGMNESLRFLGQARPVRLLPRAHELWEGKGTASRFMRPLRVVSVEPLGMQETVALQTSSRTFIAEGMMSHNSQIELRVLAGVTQEPTLLNAFSTGKDPHTATAAMMLGIPLEFVGEHERSKGKTLNFAILYGMGPKSMAERLAISLSEAKELEDAYKSQFTHIDSWTSSQKKVGLAQKYVTTWLGRVVPLWNAWSDKAAFLAQAERLAVNAPIQGGASDYVKIAMLRCQAALKQHGLWGPHAVMLTMNQHDSLVFEVDNSVDPNFLKKILHEAVVFDPRHLFPQMTVPEFPVFEVEWEMGLTWGSADKWKGDTVATWSEEHAQWHLSNAEPQPIPNVSPLTREEIVLTLPDIAPLADTFKRLVILYPDWDTAWENGAVDEGDAARTRPAARCSRSSDSASDTKPQRALAALSGNYPGDVVTQVVIDGQIVAEAETCLDEGYKGMLQIVFPGCAVSLEDG